MNEECLILIKKAEALTVQLDENKGNQNLYMSVDNELELVLEEIRQTMKQCHVDPEENQQKEPRSTKTSIDGTSTGLIQLSEEHKKIVANCLSKHNKNEVSR